MGDPHSMSHFKAPDPDLRNPTGTKNVILGPDKRHQLYMFSNTQHNNIVSAKSDCSLNTSTSLSISRENNDYFKATSSASIISLSSTFCSSLNSVRDSRRKEIYLHQHQNNWSKMIIAKKEAPSFHRRDLLLMESCEINRTITDRGASSGDDVVSLCSIRNKLNHNNSDNSNNNPSSNYKSCTELLTTSMWKVVVIMRMVMMTISKFHQRQQPQRQPLHYNYNSHRHNRVNSNCLRTFIVSVILCLLSCTNTLPPVHGQPPPLPPAGFLDFDNLPVTRFSCEGKVIGGYYADVETGCQMFHVCTLGQKDEIQDIKFLCLNGTVFDQETRVCERVDEVDCSKAEQFFDLNLDLYVSHATTQKPEDTDLEEEDDVIRPVQTAAGSKPKSSVTTTTTRQTTTTTTTPTPSPRTRPPSQPLPSRSRSPPVISGSASSQRQQQQSSSQQEEEEDEEEDDRPNGNNAYTSFNYYLKTPHSHVASGYNSQSRQSYLINQPTSRGEGRTGSSSSGPNSSGSSPNAVATAAVTSTGRKVSSASGPKTIVYSSTSTSSSSTQRPKTVVVVKATLAPSKSILRPKTLATPRTTTTTTPVPPKYELDDQYDEYYDEEDYPVEQQAPPPSSKQSSFQQTYAMSKPALISGPSSSRGGGYDFRDGRSTKGVANAGQTLISTSTGRSPLDRTKLPIAITSKPPKVTSKPVRVAPANIKVISSEFVGNNSTEEPYYYEDDYPDDASFQQQQYASPGYSSTSPSGPSKSTSSTVPTLGRGVSIIRNSSPSSVKRPSTLELSKMKQEDVTKEKDVSSSDYYDDDAENVNAHDHHFTHVDVPRIPFAKPNVPRVLVTNGKPFLPRLRRQSHYHHNYFAPYPPQPRQSFMREYLLPAAPSNYPGPYQRSTSPLLQHSYHRPSAPLHPAATNSGGVSHPQMELRREARAKAIQWGRDPFR